MDVIRQNFPHLVAGGTRVAANAHQYVAREIELAWILACLFGATADALPGPADVAGADGCAKLHAIGPGACRLEHSAVHGSDVHRDLAAVWEVQTRIGTTAEDL